MKNNFFTIFLLFVAQFFAQEKDYTQKIYKTEKEKNEFVMYLAKNYNSNAMDILSYEKKAKKYVKYIDGKTHFSQLKSYGTVIHEMCHGANFQIAHFDSSGIYISPTIKIKMPNKPVFYSSEINKIVPIEQQNKIFRYKTYVRGTTDNGLKIPFLSSNTEGIYGLLNEFVAYYQGVKSSLEIFPHVKNQYGIEKPDRLIEYLQAQSSEIYSYHEFRLFIAWYLIYAEKNHPDVYESILANQNFKVAYSLVDNNFKETIELYKLIRNNLVDELNKFGSKIVSIDENGGITVKEGNSSLTRGGPEKDIRYLESLMNDECKQALKKITIDGITNENYSTYIIK